jgi:hypothetical protein
MRSTVMVICLFFLSCRTPNKNKEVDVYLETEIKSRMAAIEGLPVLCDSLAIDPAVIDKQVYNLILLSKDIENLKASVTKANAFFLEMSGKYNLNNLDFVRLTTHMHVNDIASTLKQNELNLFNQLILRYNPKGIVLFTAH